MRFNAPPNWPQPPGDWQPPPGWQPDPAWGPVPPGWPLWVPDDQPTGAFADAPFAPYAHAPAQSGGPKTGLIVGALAVVVLLLAGAGVGGYFLFRTHPSPTTAVATPAERPTPVSTTAAAPADCSRPSSGSSKATPNALGDRVKLGDYCVSITKVVKDATTEVLAGDASNAPPKNGQFMVVMLEATYTGTTQGDTYLEVFVKLQGGDGREYDDTDCDADVPNALIDAKKLQPGQSLTASICLDISPAAATGGVVQLDAYRTDDTAFWKVG